MAESSVASATGGLLGGLVVALSGSVIAAAIIRPLVLLVNPLVLSIPVFLLPIVLNIGIGYLLMTGGRPKVGKVMIYCGAILSVVLPLFLSTLA